MFSSTAPQIQEYKQRPSTEILASDSSDTKSTGTEVVQRGVDVEQNTDVHDVIHREPRVTSRWRRIIFPLIGFSLLGGAIMTVLYFFVILDGDVNNLPPGVWDNFFDTDPFDALPPEEANRWANSGQGLDILVINALDERWHPYFEKAIADWEGGYPDALTLRTALAAPDPDCAPEQGHVVVCNGNYGATAWKGRAEILSSAVSGTIFAASARMNEYYLSSRNTDEMQYAMCHELGHTWGLHHTDENFGNRDLGNCMDYTNRHKNNLTPDQSNYQFLYALYGLAPGAQPYSPPTSAPTMAPLGAPSSMGGSNSGFGWQLGDPEKDWLFQNTTSTPGNTKEQEGEKDKKNKEDRILREESILDPNSVKLPDWLLDAILETRKDETLHGKVELPGGYILHIHHVGAEEKPILQVGSVTWPLSLVKA